MKNSYKTGSKSRGKSGGAGVISLAVIGVLASLIIAAWLWTMGLNKQEINLSNRYDSQENVIETIYENMWKTISDKYKIKGEYADDFKDSLKELTRGRSGGSMFKVSVEADTQLNLPTELYSDVMATVEGKRSEMKRALDVQTDIWRAHTDFCKDPFHNILWLDFESKVKEKPIMITSTGTKRVMDTKQDSFVLGGPTPDEI